MSVNTVPKDTIDRMMSTALSGDFKTAFDVLNQSGLNEAQKAKIESILKAPRSNMEQSIVAIFAEKNITPIAASMDQAASSQAPSEPRGVSLADGSTSPFGNAYPCSVEFGGKQYQNATACLLAQQYTDQPEIMDLFTTLNHEDATALAELNSVTKESNRPKSHFPPAAISLPSKRKRSLENPDEEHIAKKRKTACENLQGKHKKKDDLLMHVLKAKFDQNPDLKKQLLATENAHLVCQDHGLSLSDNMDGTGENALGTSLMRLRGEYRSTDQVEPPAADQSTGQSPPARSHSLANELYPDIIERFFNGYLCGSDFKTLSVLACVNKHWNKYSSEFWDKLDLKQVYPELTILDAKAQGVKCEDEPKISKFRLIKGFKEISPHVEGNAGVTQLTMTKGTTLNQLEEIAKGEGITVDVLWDRIVPTLGDVAVEQTYGILITNNVFLNSRNKAFNSQKTLVEGDGCEMPTVQEYVALCVYTNKVFKKCLYGQNPWTFGRSSTHVGNYPLVVGGSAPARLRVHNPATLTMRSFGAGGQRKF